MKMFDIAEMFLSKGTILIKSVFNKSSSKRKDSTAAI